MPSLGADMEAGTVVEWLVKPGDIVHKGDIVAVVDTDKANIDIETFDAGTVGELLVPVGLRVPVGTPLATLLAEGAEPAMVTAPPTAPTPISTPPRSHPSRRLLQRPRPPRSGPRCTRPSSDGSPGTWASTSARCKAPGPPVPSLVTTSNAPPRQDRRSRLSLRPPRQPSRLAHRRSADQNSNWPCDGPSPT